MLTFSATAMQHVCLAKALLLIRELEVYSRSMGFEQRDTLKVRHAIPLILSKHHRSQ